MGTRVLIPVPIGLVELFVAKQVKHFSLLISLSLLWINFMRLNSVCGVETVRFPSVIVGFIVRLLLKYELFNLWDLQSIITMQIITPVCSNIYRYNKN